MVAVGDVVQIPFRHRTVLGVVQSITASTIEKRVLPLTSGSIGFTIPSNDLERITTIASELGQSTSSILNVAYEGLSAYPASPHPKSFATHPSPSSPAIDQPTISSVHTILDRLTSDRALSVACDDETFCVLAHALCKTIKHQILILVPRERDARFLATMLRSTTPTVLTGKVSSHDRNAILRSWHSGSIRVLIGTRQATLIPPHSLGAVLVYQSACSDHQSPLRNPHIHAVRAAEALARSTGAPFVACDTFPEPSATLPLVVTTDGADATLIDVMHKGENSPYPLLSQTLLAAIDDALTEHKKVLLSFNRKGVAKRIECKACGYVPFCGTCGSLPTVRIDDLLCTACGTEMWRPTECPSCRSPKIGLKSIGGTKIADDLHKAFPNAIIGHIEKGRYDRDADILLATEFFFSSVIEPFHSYGFGVVAEILADVGFIPGDFRGAETTARKIARLRHLAHRESATCIIQTLTRDRVQSLLGAEYVHRTELDARKKYCLPPFGVVVEFETEEGEVLPNELKNSKISHESFAHWQTLFPTLPDSVKIRVSQ